MKLSEAFNRNNLGAETSPMLRAHADSALHWQTFSPELVAEAERVNRPLLVLISTRESLAEFDTERLFDNRELATLINGSFIPVMVDADERPDFAAFYIEFSVFFHRMSSWPLIFATTAEGAPIEHVPRDSGGKIGVGQAISWARGISDRWRLNARQMKEKAAENVNAIDRLLTSVTKVREEDDVSADADFLSSVYSGLSTVSDDEFGTFTMGRSFIRPTLVSSAIKIYAAFPDSDYRKERTGALVRKSLDAMESGGIYDHVFGGWYRDSDGPTWNSPRGGKYLVDQAEMIVAYLDGYRAFGDDSYLERARLTGDFILDFLQSNDGQFRHGMFSRSDFGLKSPIYWRPEDIQSSLDDEQYEVIKVLSKLSRYGNVPSFKNDGRSRANVLAILESPEVAADTLKMDHHKMLRIWNGAMNELRKNEQRLNLWAVEDFVLLGESCRTVNALMYLWQVTGDEKYKDAAFEGMEFVRKNFLRGEPETWPRLWSRGGSGTKAFPEDLLAVSTAGLAVFEAGGDTDLLELAIAAADEVLDKQSGESDGESGLLKRYEMWDITWRTSDDKTTPNVHGLGLEVCRELAVITGEEKWLNRYDELSSAFKAIVNEWLLFASGSAINVILSPPRETKLFVVPADPGSSWHPGYLKAWKDTFPNELIMVQAPDSVSADGEWNSHVSPVLSEAAGNSQTSIIQALK